MSSHIEYSKGNDIRSVWALLFTKEIVPDHQPKIDTGQYDEKAIEENVDEDEPAP